MQSSVNPQNYSKQGNPQIVRQKIEKVFLIPLILVRLRKYTWVERSFLTGEQIKKTHELIFLRSFHP